MKLQNIFTNKIVEFKEDLDNRIWVPIEEHKKTTSKRKALTIQDFFRVREFKEGLRKQFSEYCR